ncbi:hypothetical protein [Carboxydothermus pertinax]|uniref:hypothetical protein n=1 Tax=Carboxydothermus pertinax TaxID=870242 RepID=UPI00096ABD97|nr:hypothetical protein [Carboxydothermus pertinax]
MRKKVSLFYPFLGFLIFTVGSILIAPIIFGILNPEARLNWWWKFSLLGFFLALLYSAKFLIPVEKLPINNLTKPPQSRLEFLKQIAVGKQILLVSVLILPALVILTLFSNIPLIQTIICFPGMIIVALTVCTWNTAVNLSPTLRQRGWKFILKAILILSLFLVLYIFTEMAIPGPLWGTVVEKLIFLILFSAILFLLTVKESYRGVRLDWAGENHSSS